MSTGPGTENGSPKAEPQPGRSPRASACEPYREIIEAALSQGRNATGIFQDLVDRHGFAGKYPSDRGPAKPEGSTYRLPRHASDHSP